MAIVAAFAVPHPPLIIPAVGKGSEQGIQATVDAYQEVGRHVAELRPDTVVITSPHSIMYRDYFHISPGAEARGSFAQFRAADLRFGVKYDEELLNQIIDFEKDFGYIGLEVDFEDYYMDFVEAVVDCIAIVEVVVDYNLKEHFVDYIEQMKKVVDYMVEAVVD